MRILHWLSAAITYLRQNALSDANGRDKRRQVERGVFCDASTFGDERFAADYRLSTYLMGNSINKHFPDYHAAKSRVRFDPGYDYCEKKSEAIYVSSAAIALALRSGTNVVQAVISGHKSIGL